MSLCRAYSAPAIRSKPLPWIAWQESEGPVFGGRLEAYGFQYMHRGVHCAAALPNSISVAAQAGTTIQPLAELG